MLTTQNQPQWGHNHFTNMPPLCCKTAQRLSQLRVFTSGLVHLAPLFALRQGFRLDDADIQREGNSHVRSPNISLVPKMEVGKPTSLMYVRFSTSILGTWNSWWSGGQFGFHQISEEYGMTSDGIGQIWVSGVGVCSGSVKIGEDF